jgi:glycosyltransferase involved in cell wall biosynthesis
LQLRDLYRRAAQVDADCYHCNEMDSWFIGVLLKLTRGKRVVFDVHEHYPSTFSDSRFPQWSHPMIAAGVRLWVRLQLPFTDYVVLAKKSVAEEYRSARNILLVQNFTPLWPSRARRNGSNRGNRVWAVHLGLISRLRGWPQMLEALAHTTKDIGLWVIGTFNDGSRLQFDQRARDLGLSERIRVEEWLPFDQVMERLFASHIGLVLFQPGVRNHVMASPHKIFDYMQAGLAVIAPDFAVEVAEVVRESGCGVLVNPADPVEIADALDRLAEHTSERTYMGQAGRRAVEERYNWEAEGKKLVELYREMSASARQGSRVRSC